MSERDSNTTRPTSTEAAAMPDQRALDQSMPGQASREAIERRAYEADVVTSHSCDVLHVTITGKQHKRAAIGLLQVSNDLLTRRGEEAVGVGGLGEIGFDVERRLLGVIEGRAELQSVGIRDAEAGGDVFERGGD